ncbi:MAG: hypothetical protein GY842_12625 [bacterium]|nr:hypothetical protein [bacterium]
MNEIRKVNTNAVRHPGGPRAQLEHELHGLRRRLAEAWWYEESLETIQELEGLIAVRRRALSAAR